METATRTNSLGQPVGPPVVDWHPPPFPEPTACNGQYARVEPLDASMHAAQLYDANADDSQGEMWTYLSYGPFETLAEYRNLIVEQSQSRDPSFYAVVDIAAEKALGVLSYMRIDTRNGVIELGHLAYSPRMQRTRVSTEALYLLMDRAFGLGYRRLEWKCDSLNAPSRRAAERFGFSFEGVFRQAVVTKGRNRDTAWFSILDREWPKLRNAFEIWLAPNNFRSNGSQYRSLSALTRDASLSNTGVLQSDV